jgi:hypothetical protein
MPDPARWTNQYFTLPKESDAWVSAYVAQFSQTAGVYLRFKRTAVGERLYNALLQDRAAIDAALGVPLEWHTEETEKHNWIDVTRNFEGVLNDVSRTDVQQWLADHIERFIAVFRPRLEHLLREQSHA